jgi:hypothetical protein
MGQRPRVPGAEVAKIVEDLLPWSPDVHHIDWLCDGKDILP